jgi:hypothetical protein
MKWECTNCLKDMQNNFNHFVYYRDEGAARSSDKENFICDPCWTEWVGSKIKSYTLAYCSVCRKDHYENFFGYYITRVTANKSYDFMVCKKCLEVCIGKDNI